MINNELEGACGSRFTSTESEQPETRS